MDKEQRVEVIFNEAEGLYKEAMEGSRREKLEMQPGKHGHQQLRPPPPLYWQGLEGK